MIRETLTSWLPRRFLTTRGFKYLYSFALVADATLEAALQGMAASIPGLGTPTALPRIGRDRGIRRGFAETDEHYSERLEGFITDQKKRGSVFELLREIQGYLSPLSPRIRHVITKTGLGATYWRTLNSDGTTETNVAMTNWVWDGDESTLTTRAWIIIYSTAPNNVWDEDGTWDDTATRTWDEDEATVLTWGSTATLEQIQGVRDIVRDWKSAQTLVPEILICFDDSLFDPGDANPPNPDGNWRYYSKNVGGVQVLARAENTVYWQGCG